MCLHAACRRRLAAVAWDAANAMTISEQNPTGAERPRYEPQTLFGRVVDRIAAAAGAIAGLCVVGILLLVCVEVGLRQFRKSMLVTDEIGGYLNAALVFLGLAYTLRSGGFIRVELVYDALPPPLRRLACWVFTATAAAFVAAITYYGYLHVRYAFNQDTRAVSVLETPEWIPQSVMVLGLAVLVLQLVAFLVERVRNVP
jgi:TRAP-type C4-dicarboxylate transport system permease small subunit